MSPWTGRRRGPQDRGAVALDRADEARRAFPPGLRGAQSSHPRRRRGNAVARHPGRLGAARRPGAGGVRFSAGPARGDGTTARARRMAGALELHGVERRGQGGQHQQPLCRRRQGQPAGDRRSTAILGRAGAADAAMDGLDQAGGRSVGDVREFRPHRTGDQEARQGDGQERRPMQGAGSVGGQALPSIAAAKRIVDSAGRQRCGVAVRHGMACADRGGRGAGWSALFVETYTPLFPRKKPEPGEGELRHRGARRRRSAGEARRGRQTGRGVRAAEGRERRRHRRGGTRLEGWMFEAPKGSGVLRDQGALGPAR